MDNMVICNFIDKFENVPFADLIGKFLKLDLQRAETFITNYENSMKIDICPESGSVGSKKYYRKKRTGN